MSAEEEEAITLEAFNLCCGWLAGNGHGAAATALAAFLNGVPLPPPSVEATEVHSPRLDAVASRGLGYTGDECSNCHGMRMKVSGHCMVCEDCGTTTGCS